MDCFFGGKKMGQLIEKFIHLTGNYTQLNSEATYQELIESNDEKNKGNTHINQIGLSKNETVTLLVKENYTKSQSCLKNNTETTSKKWVINVKEESSELSTLMPMQVMTEYNYINIKKESVI